MVKNNFPYDMSLRILFLQPQPCVRTLKYAKALKYYFGKRVSLCLGYTGYSLDEVYGYGNEYFERMIKLDPKDVHNDIHGLIDDFKPVLIHSHNAPNTLTLVAIQVSGDVPVIHDVHEVLSIHNSGFFGDDDETTLTEYCEDEKKTNEGSNARIYATQGIQDYIRSHYNVDAENDLVFNNYVSESLMPRYFEEKLSKSGEEINIVYIGCVTSVVEESHYDLREIFKDIASNQMHIHIYPTKNIITQSNHSYKKLADNSEFIHFHSNMNQKNLLQEITQYDFGWAGFNRAENNKHLEIALPNKVIEYVACGLPVLAFPHKNIQRFIEKNEVGLTFHDIDDLKELLKNRDLSHIREKALIFRHQLTLEKQIPKVVDFYEQIVSDKQPY